MRGGRAEHFNQVLEMRAEGRETGEDRLLVADIGVDVVEYRDPGTESDGRGDPRLNERGEKPERLEEHGLAAGVGPGDEQRALVREHLEIEWNDVDTLRDEKRVAALDDRESVGGIGQLRRSAPEFHSVPRTRHERVENDERFETLRQLFTVRSDLLRQLGEDALDLFDLLALQLANPVPGLDRRRWLDEQRPSCLRCVVHDSA